MSTSQSDVCLKQSLQNVLTDSAWSQAVSMSALTGAGDQRLGWSHRQRVHQAPRCKAVGSSGTATGEGKSERGSYNLVTLAISDLQTLAPTHRVGLSIRERVQIGGERDSRAVLRSIAA